MKSRISIIICTRNAALRIGQLVSALCRQIPGPKTAHIVLVDNASCDDTADRAFSAALSAGKPDLLTVVSEKNPGKTHALNAGLERAKGEIVAFLDDDVIVAKDWLEKLLRAFENPRIDGIGGAIDPLWDGPSPTWFTPAVSAFTPVHDLGPKPMPYSPPWLCPVGANMAFSSKIIEKTGLFDTSLGHIQNRPLGAEEGDYAMRAAAQGFKLWYEPSVKVLHPFKQAEWTPRALLKRAFYQGLGAGLQFKKHGAARLFKQRMQADIRMAARQRLMGRTPLYFVLKLAFLTGFASARLEPHRKLAQIK
jgi:glycosyltransferase involved in cell wall biosynthesis